VPDFEKTAIPAPTRINPGLREFDADNQHKLGTQTIAEMRKSQDAFLNFAKRRRCSKKLVASKKCIRNRSNPQVDVRACQGVIFL
jgi:hypothetical protein